MSDDDLFDQAGAAQETYDASDDFLMAEGGKPAGFRQEHKLGHVVQGIVLSKQVRQQTDYATGKPKFYDDGNPQMQLVITIQTKLKEDITDSKTGKLKVTAADDDGQRCLYIKGQSKAELRDAVKAAGDRGVRIGATIAMKWAENKPSGKGNPLKVYKVKYSPPGTVTTGEAPAAEPAKAQGTMAQIKKAAAEAKAAAKAAEEAAAAEAGNGDEPPF